jgi:hypothetical protein
MAERSWAVLGGGGMAEHDRSWLGAGGMAEHDRSWLGAGGMAEHDRSWLGAGGMAEQARSWLGGGGMAEQARSWLGGGGMAEQARSWLGGGGMAESARLVLFALNSIVLMLRLLPPFRHSRSRKIFAPLPSRQIPGAIRRVPGERRRLPVPRRRLPAPSLRPRRRPRQGPLSDFFMPSDRSPCLRDRIRVAGPAAAGVIWDEKKVSAAGAGRRRRVARAGRGPGRRRPGQRHAAQ